MRSDPDLGAMARRVIDANQYMTLATLDPDGRPRLSPVYYTAARYTVFYWVSSPEAHHSRNLAERPEVQIVIFDSTVPVGQGEAVYLRGTAKQMPDEELEAVLPEAFRTAAGARRFDVDGLRGGAPFRLTWPAQPRARSMWLAVTRYTAAESTPPASRSSRGLTRPRRIPGH